MTISIKSCRILFWTYTNIVSKAITVKNQISVSVFTIRKPMLLLLLLGLLLFRFATRQLLALLFQLPPRLMRLEPEAGPDFMNNTLFYIDILIAILDILIFCTNHSFTISTIFTLIEIRGYMLSSLCDFLWIFLFF